MIIQTILVSLFSAFVGASLKILHDYISFQREKISMLYAAAAEIESLIDIAEFRNYENTLGDYVDSLRGGHDLKIIDFIGDIDQWRPIYKNSVSKIGMFGADSASSYIKFHIRIASISKDLKNSEHINGFPLEYRAEVIEDMKKLWSLAKSDGSTAIEKIRSDINRSFFRHLC
jgi:hypothetical protein